MPAPPEPPEYVLVVDDEDDIRESMMEYLEAHGFLALGAPDGKRALELLADPTKRPCVVVLDFMMPIMDARGFRREQLRTAEIADIPVVLISAYTNLTETAAELGIDEYFIKPIDPVCFLQVIRAHCRAS